MRAVGVVRDRCNVLLQLLQRAEPRLRWLEPGEIELGGDLGIMHARALVLRGQHLAVVERRALRIVACRRDVAQGKCHQHARGTARLLIRSLGDRIGLREVTGLYQAHGQLRPGPHA